jgi:hypothetical protein
VQPRGQSYILKGYLQGFFLKDSHLIEWVSALAGPLILV